MQLNEMSFDGATPIDGYGPGFFRIGGQAIEGGVLVTTRGARRWGGYEDMRPRGDIKEEVDVLFVGPGADTAHIPSGLRQPLEAAGLGVEVMNSPAACRTYNVLLSEGRRVAVALLPV